MDASPGPIVQPRLHRLARLDDARCRALPWQPFPRDWNGESVPVTVGAAFRLATDDRSLRFEARCLLPPGPPLPGASRGAFTRELWTRDVAELFVGEEGTSRYTEWNLSPQGAWWAREFQSRRVPAPDQSLPAQVATWTADRPAGSSGWEAGLLFPLPAGCNPHRLRINVTMILGDSPRRYLATLTVSGTAPDFHLVEWFPAPVVLEAGPSP